MRDKIDDSILQVLRDIEDECHPMSCSVPYEHLGDKAEEYGITGEYIGAGIMLDTATGDFKVYKYRTCDQKEFVGKGTKLYKLLYSMVDFDTLQNEYVFQLKYPDWMDKIVDEYFVYDNVDYHLRYAFSSLKKDLKTFLVSADNLADITSKVSENNRNSGNLEMLYEGFTDFIRSYQPVIVTASDIYCELDEDLNDNSVYYLDENVKKDIEYLHDKLKTIYYTGPVYNHIIDSYNDFLSLAVDKKGYDNSTWSAKLADCSNRCLSHISRLRIYTPLMYELAECNVWG